MKKIMILLSMTGFIGALHAQDLKVGDKAPVFKAVDENGKTWDAANVIGKNVLVVYFFPAAFTGGCTAEACAYRDHQDDFSKLGATVIGISGDEPQNLAYFRKANNLNFTLLSDSDGKVAKAFGVTTRSGGDMQRQIDGKTVDLKRGITAMRWTFIIGKDGKIIYKDDAVNPSTDYDKTLNKIKETLAQK